MNLDCNCNIFFMSSCHTTTYYVYRSTSNLVHMQQVLQYIKLRVYDLPTYILSYLLYLSTYFAYKNHILTMPDSSTP